MFKSLFGAVQANLVKQKSISSVQGIVVKAVVPINDKTKSTIIQLLKKDGTISVDDNALLDLKRLSLKHSYTRAISGQGKYIAVGDTDRSSAWYMAGPDQSPDPSRTIILTEKRNGNVFQPSRVLTGGEKATFAMVFEPPCCEDADSILICFNQGANFSWKIVLSETALAQNVGNYFKQRVEVGRVTEAKDLPVIAETIKHLTGVPCDCTLAGKFAAYKEPA